jgi:hypothetical protein
MIANYFFSLVFGTECILKLVVCVCVCVCVCERECVLFNGTRFSNLYTAVDSCVCVCV